jgi:hypothetical protein
MFFNLPSFLFGRVTLSNRNFSFDKILPMLPPVEEDAERGDRRVCGLLSKAGERLKEILIRSRVPPSTWLWCVGALPASSPLCYAEPTEFEVRSSRQLPSEAM